MAANIDIPYLTDPSSASIAMKMSWISTRKTTRVEDIAYCLLGLFDVNMPLLYGEGEKAFLRLQLEIINRSDDETIFAWTSNTKDAWGLLAPRPSNFKYSGGIYSIPFNVEKRQPYRMTQQGMEFHPPSTIYGFSQVIGSYLVDETIIIALNCRSYSNGHNFPVAICLKQFGGTWQRVNCCDLIPRLRHLTCEYNTGQSGIATIYIHQDGL